MSSIKLAPNASGTGEFTIAAPNSNTNRTFNLPDSSGTIATTESTLSQFNASGSAPVYACRAWVNFNGKGTIAIRSSGNVSSLTDNAVGSYTVNFTNAMPDANYAGVATARFEVTGGGVDYTSSVAVAELATTSVRVYTADNASPNTAEDEALICVAIFR